MISRRIVSERRPRAGPSFFAMLRSMSIQVRDGLPSDLSPEASAEGEAPCAKEGYVALLSVLIVSAIAASTILILFVTSLNATLNSGDVAQGKIAKALAESCVELGLQRLTSGLVTTLCSGCPLTYVFAGQGSCTIDSITDIGGSIYRIRATGSNLANSITKYVEAKARRTVTGSAATLVSWEEKTGF